MSGLSRSRTAWKNQGVPGETIVAFFHPEALCGGGGERVLWTMIDALQKRDRENESGKTPRYVIYTSAPVPDSFSEASEKIQSQFNILLERPVEFIPVMKSHLIDGNRYRRFTMIRQAFGSIRLARECLTRLCPDYWVDTTGFAFCYPIARIAGCRVMTYTHYPAVSTDMLSFVQSRQTAHNNSSTITRSALLTRVKALYYEFFAFLYRLCGKCPQLVMVNSSWTLSHMKSLWHGRDVRLVFPPVPVDHLMTLPLTPRENDIISVAQFRPEKRHDFQIRIFAEVLKNCQKVQLEELPRLILVGGCRTRDDQERVTELKAMARQFGIEDRVVFECNAPYEMLAGYLGTSRIGLHTMWNEHFGIGIVEYMAAGCITVAHRSGGPAMDIVTPADDGTDDGPTGFLADSMEAYVDILCRILLGEVPPEEIEKIQIRARKRCREFSEDAFTRKVQERVVFE